MQGDSYPIEGAVSAPEPTVAVRLEAATTLIGDDGEPDGAVVQGADVESRGGASASLGPTAPLPATPAPAPPLRVILALRPRPGEEGAAPAYDVTISADRGKEAACDPYWRSFEALDLHGALDEAAGVVAAAEEKWRSDPRYPRVTAQSGKAATKPAAGGKGKATPAEKRTPAAPTAVLPAITSVAAAAIDPTSGHAAPAPATSPVPRVAETSAKDAEPTGDGQLVTPAVGGPPLPLGKPPTSAKNAGDRKQLSLFG